MDYDKLARLLYKRLKKELSERRAAHSVGVAKLAERLCLREGLEPGLGLAAGLAHDLCKEMPLDKRLRLASIWLVSETGQRAEADRDLAARDMPGRSIEAAPEERLGLMQEKILHGPAAAALLASEYGVADREFLNALAFHSLGRRGMGELESIIFCADKLEEGRQRIDGVFRERCLELPLPDMLREVLRDGVAWLKSKGYAVANQTIDLYNSLDERSVRR